MLHLSSPKSLRDEYDYVIVGGSVAGIRALLSVVEQDPQASVLVVDQDPHQSYDKPPLSKGFLMGTVDESSLRLATSELWDSPQIDAIFGVAAEELLSDRRIRVGGRWVSAGGIVIASGCRMRYLPTMPKAWQMGLRTIEDARRIRDRADAKAALVMVGAGFIGLEVASSMLALGLSVDVIEANAVPMQGSLGDVAGTWFSTRARRNGLRLHLGTQIDGFELDRHKNLAAVVLSSGSSIPCDMVLTGIGVEPNVEWLQGSGIEVADGVLCDAHLQTSMPGVFAAGDVARFPNPMGPGTMRVEHWVTASELGTLAGANAVAWRRAAPMTACRPVPYAWSDQFGIKMQMAGWLAGADRVTVQDLTDTTLLIDYWSGAELGGVLGVGHAMRVNDVRRQLAARVA